MDTNQLIEFENCLINGTNHLLPLHYWLNSINNFLAKINVEGVSFTPLDHDKNVTIITSKEAFMQFLKKNEISHSSFDTFRLEVKNTRSNGEVLVFREGIKSMSFNCQVIQKLNEKYILLYSLEGSRSVESIYIHGIWKTNTQEDISK